MDINIISRQQQIQPAPVSIDEARTILYKGCWKNYITNPDFTPEESDIIAKLLRYFLNDPDGPYDITKGLYIYGYYGTGKTKLMQVFQEFCRAINYYPFGFVNYKNVLRQIQTDGIASIKKIAVNYAICIDDLGFLNEGDIRYFGNKINTLSEIVYERYVKYEHQRTKTYYTSNLILEGKKESIQEMYGDGIAGRIKDSCNVIKYSFKPRR